MSAPPGVARTSSSNRSNSVSGMEDLKSAAQIILWNCGVPYGPNRIYRLCAEFVERVQGNGFDFFDFLANKVALSVEERRRALADPEVQRVISYADPTGEAAVARAMRSGR